MEALEVGSCRALTGNRSTAESRSARHVGRVPVADPCLGLDRPAILAGAGRTALERPPARGAPASIRAIARELDLDRKTVRRCLRQTAWTPYEREVRSDTLLTPHAAYLRRRAAEVGYSAQVLFQELRRRQYAGSYETVKRFVRPLRETQLHAAVTRTRFETPPGLQSQIDWGQARVWLGAQREIRHIFVLTLGFSRRSVYVPCLSETLGELPPSRATPAASTTSGSCTPPCLSTMAAQWRPLAEQATRARQASADYLAQLAHLEVTGRQERRIQRRMQEARFPMLKTLDAFSFDAQPGLDRDAVLQVFGCRFVAEAAHVVLVGGVGTGKTHLAIALGMACCQLPGPHLASGGEG